MNFQDDDDLFDFLGPSRPRKIPNIRLRNPLRPEVYEAARTGNISVLGSHRELVELAQTFRLHSERIARAVHAKWTFTPHKLVGSFMGWTMRAASGFDEMGEVENVREALKLVSRHRKTVMPQNLPHAPVEEWSSEAVGYMAVRLLVEDFAWCGLETMEGDGTYPSHLGKAFLQGWVWPLSDSTVMLGVSHGIAWLKVDGMATPLFPDMCRLLYELVAARGLVLLANDHLLATRQPHALPPAALRALLAAGDATVAKDGREAYRTLKLLEALCTGELISRDDDMGMYDRTEFLNEVTADAHSAALSREGGWWVSLARGTLQGLTPPQVSQIFGLFRIWGYPMVDARGGVLDVRKSGCRAKLPNRDAVARVTAKVVEIFCMNYFEREGRWPNIVFLGGTEDELGLAIATGRRPDMHSRKYYPSDWLGVQSRKTFEPRETLTDLDLIADKACSATKAEIQESLRNSGKLPAPQTRRTLLRYLKQTEFDIFELLDRIDKEGFTKDELVIGVTPKERELKIFPRLFSLLTFNVKCYISATEQLLADHILPCFPDITMTMSSATIKQRMHAIGRGTARPHGASVVITTNIDFERWNLNECPTGTQPAFQFFDGLFGYSRVISRTHEVFAKALFYVADGYAVLEEQDFERPRGWKTWTGHTGGMEGLRQKGWTILTSAGLRLVAEEHGVSLTIMGQGDNQVLVCTIPLPHFSAEGAGPENALTTARLTFRTVIAAVHALFDQLELPIKPVETWTSVSLFAYGKVLLHKGVTLPMSLKKYSRMYYPTDDLLPTLFHTISGLFAAAEAACEPDYEADTALFLAFLEARLAILQYRRWSPLSGRPILSGRGTGSELWEWSASCDEGRRREAVRGRGWILAGRIWELIEVLSLLNGDFGAYPIVNYYSLSIRGFPDPVCGTIGYAQKYLRESRTHISPTVRDAVLAALSPEMATTVEPLRLFEDPVGLNTVHPDLHASLLKRTARTLLESSYVENNTVRKVVALAASREEALAEYLYGMTPLLPRLGADIVDHAPSGVARRVTGRFENTRSLQQVAKQAGNWGEGRLGDKASRADSERFAFFLWTISRRVDYELATTPAYEHAQYLRTMGWQRQIEGVTTPLPISFTEFELTPVGVCRLCERNPARMTVRLSAGETVRSIRETLGGASGYFGGETRQKQSAFSPRRFLSRTGPLSAAKKLVRYLGWLAVEEGNLAKAISMVVRSLTDVPLDHLVDTVLGVDSSAGHRLQDLRTHHGGHPGLIRTPYTHMAVSTNTMAAYTRVDKDFPIHYQQLICYAQLVGAAMYSDHPMAEMTMHLHITSPREVPELTDHSTEIADQVPEDLTIHADEDVPLVFTSKDRVGSVVRLRQRGAGTELDLRNASENLGATVFSIVAAQEVGRFLQKGASGDAAVDQPCLSHVWYTRIRPGRFLEHLAKIIVTSCLSETSRADMRQVGSSQTWLQAARELALRRLTTWPQWKFEPLCPLWTLAEPVQALIAKCSWAQLPSGAPPTTSAVCRAVRLTVASSIMSFSFSSGRMFLPFQYELVDSPVGCFGLRCNLTAAWLEHNETGLVCSETIGQYTGLQRAVSSAYQYAVAKGGSVSVGEMYKLLERTFVLDAKTRGIRADDHLRGALEVQFIRHSLETVRGITCPLPPPSRSLRWRVPLPSTASVVEVSLTDVVCRAVDLGQLRHEVPGTSDRHLLKPVMLETTAAYKWAPILAGLRGPRNRPVAAVGDGSGGVTAVLAAMFPESLLLYNTLFRPERTTPNAHVEYVPPAVIRIPGATERLIGLNCLREGASDLTNHAWPDCVSVSDPRVADLAVVCCDAEGDVHDDRKIHLIIKTLSRLATTCGASDTTVIVKAYYSNLRSLVTALTLADRAFKSVRLYCSRMSSSRATECFIRMDRPKADLTTEIDPKDSALQKFVSPTVSELAKHYEGMETITVADVDSSNELTKYLTAIGPQQVLITQVAASWLDLGIPPDVTKARDAVQILSWMLFHLRDTTHTRRMAMAGRTTEHLVGLERHANKLAGLAHMLVGMLLGGHSGLVDVIRSKGTMGVLLSSDAYNWALVPLVGRRHINEVHQLLASTGNLERTAYLKAIPIPFFKTAEGKALVREFGTVFGVASGPERKLSVQFHTSFGCTAGSHKLSLVYPSRVIGTPVEREILRLPELRSYYTTKRAQFLPLYGDRASAAGQEDMIPWTRIQ
uniref:Replicase n=1 Tax=Soybean cyst nematode associated northern cereal mosaic virus TaxID=1034378 RepID=G0WXQ6_9RHAB|nr:putative RNA-dependent RNA polymerase [Soybean cyst nematode associated northern cereal mosaic virus]